MDKIEINEVVFKKMIDGVKHSVATDDSRPIFKYIKIKVTKENVIAYACDGVRASRVQTKLNNPAESEFECFIKPLAIKPNKGAELPVLLECDGENAFVEVMTEYGKVRYCFKQPPATVIDIEKVYNENRAHDREIAFNANLAMQALKALLQIEKQNKVIFEIKDNPRAAFIIRAENEFLLSEQLIMPMRF